MGLPRRGFGVRRHDAAFEPHPLEASAYLAPTQIPDLRCIYTNAWPESPFEPLLKSDFLQ